MFSRQTRALISAWFFPVISAVSCSVAVAILGNGKFLQSVPIVRTTLLFCLPLWAFLNGVIVGWRTREIHGPSRRIF